MPEFSIFLRSVYAATAAVLLVALGLGLIYLVAMDRMAPGVALGILLGGASAIPLVVALREFGDTEQRRRE